MGPTHLEALRRNGVQVTGVLGVDIDEGQRAAQRLGLPHVYDTFDEICQDPNVDVVHLCTPNHLHYSMARQALLAGKHVLCEKPLAMDSAEAKDLIAVEQASGRVGAVNHNLRFYPLCQEAHVLVQSGKIGEVRLLHGEYCQDWLTLPSDWNWRLLAKEGGALRAVSDIGTHWMDMVTWITGLRITAVMADFATFIPVRQKPVQPVDTFTGKLEKSVTFEAVQVDTEDYAGILLRFDNGARGVLTLSQINPGRKNHFFWEINGSDASLWWDQEEPNSLGVGYRDQPNQVILKDPSLLQPEVRGYAAYPGGHAEGYPDTHTQLVKTLYAYLAAGDYRTPRSFPTFEDGWRELALCDAILASARQQRWVEVE
jgi:predicted dehydrogenase